MVVKVFTIFLLLSLSLALKVTTEQSSFLQDDDNTSENAELQYYLNGITDYPGYVTLVVACSGGTCQPGVPLTQLQTPTSTTPTNPVTKSVLPTNPPTNNQQSGPETSNPPKPNPPTSKPPNSNPPTSNPPKTNPPTSKPPRTNPPTSNPSNPPKGSGSGKNQ